jgi:hypothetical protein
MSRSVKSRRTKSILVLALLLTSMFAHVINPAYGALLFSDGFETTPNHYSNWTGTATTGAAVLGETTVWKAEGSYSSNHILGGSFTDDCLAYKDMSSAQDEVFTRIYFNVSSWSSDAGANRGVSIMEYYSSTGRGGTTMFYVQLYKQAFGEQNISIWYRDGAALQTTTAGIWTLKNEHYIEMYKDHAASGNYTVWLDGVKIWTVTADTDNYQVNCVGVGAEIGTAGTSNNAVIQIDAVQIDTEYIGPLPPSGTPGHPVGQLRKGNSSLGTNPSYFYDENGGIVTLRQLQSGHIDQTTGFGGTFYTDAVGAGGYAGETWANATLSYADDAGFNTLRIHMFFGRGQPDIAPSRRVWNYTALSEFITHLTLAKAQSIYYVLDGYWHGGYNNWWLIDEFNASSLLWNTTVRDDFVWYWGKLINELETNTTTYDHLVYIEPWSEWVTDFGADIILNSRDPYRFNGSDPTLGNASLVSWNNWLKKTFSNDASAMQTTFDEGTADLINASKQEIPFFNNSMPQTSWSGGSVRAYYFTLWYQECLCNFTSYFNTQLKGNQTDLYISWDGFKADYDFGGAMDVGVGDTPAYCCIKNSDVLDHHTFGSYSEGYAYWASDEVLSEYSEFSSLARALEIPIVVGEQGPSTSLGVNYATGKDADNIANFRLFTNTMISLGYAGWTPYWTSYWHAYETSNVGRVTACDNRLPYNYEINKEWRAAENYAGDIKYNNITMLVGLGTTYRGEGDMYPYTLSLGGFTPKYTIWSLGNGTRMPDAIPSDTEVLYISGTYYSSYYAFRSDMKMVATWMAGDSDRKIILHNVLAKDHLYNTYRWEDDLDTALFPINNMAYGVGYTDNNNSTDCYVYADDTLVFLSRSDNYHSQHGLTWTVGDITGDVVGTVNDSAKAWVLVNDRVGWIAGTAEQYQTMNTAQNYDDDYNCWKLFKAIFNKWEISPTVTANLGTREISSHARKASDWRILTIGNNNITSSETYDMSLNSTTWVLTGTFLLFDELAETRIDITAATLENTGFTTTLSRNNTNHIVIRNNTIPCYIWSTGYLEDEAYTDGNETLRLDFSGENGEEDTIYIYWPSYPTGDVDYGNGTTRDAADFYDPANEIIVIPVEYGDSTITIMVDGLRGAWVTTINGVDTCGKVNFVLDDDIMRVNLVP